jgi:hypothetical protein
LVSTVGASAFGVDRASAAWGPWENGAIPLEELAPIPWAPPFRLRKDAAADLISLNEAFRAQFGYDLPINDGYRDYAGQVEAKRRFGSDAATPGTSNHGWAIAIDVADRNRSAIGFAHPIYLWLKASEGRYGWIHPGWAEPGGVGPDEAWHWEYNGSYSGGPGPVLQEVNMEAIVKAPNGVIVHLRQGGKTDFGSQEQYNTFRMQVNTLRGLGATDLLPLPELSSVPGVTWDTFNFLAQYIGAPAS